MNLSFVHKNGSEYIKEIGKPIPLYRGMRDQNQQSFIADPRLDRKAKHSSEVVTQFGNWLIAQTSNTVTRNNCFFCTYDWNRARSYGTVYEVWPLDGYNYVWSPYISDFFSDIRFADGEDSLMSSYIEEIQEIYELQYENPQEYLAECKKIIEEFGEVYKKTDLKSAIGRKNEILITGRCLFVKSKKNT